MNDKAEKEKLSEIIKAMILGSAAANIAVQLMNFKPIPLSDDTKIIPHELVMKNNIKINSKCNPEKITNEIIKELEKKLTDKNRKKMEGL